MDRHIPLVISKGDPFTRGLHWVVAKPARNSHRISKQAANRLAIVDSLYGLGE